MLRYPLAFDGKEAELPSTDGLTEMHVLIMLLATHLMKSHIVGSLLFTLKKQVRRQAAINYHIINPVLPTGQYFYY